MFVDMYTFIFNNSVADELYKSTTNGFLNQITISHECTTQFK